MSDQRENPDPTPSSSEAPDTPADRAAPPNDSIFDDESRAAIPWYKRLEELIWSVSDETAGRIPFVKRWLQIAHRSVNGFRDHDGFDNASALTYASLLSLVPLLALLMALMTVFGDKAVNVREELKKFPVVQSMRITLDAQSQDAITTATVTAARGADAAPSSAADPVLVSVGDADSPFSAAIPKTITGEYVIDLIFDFVKAARIEKLGILGILGLLWTVQMLLSRIESGMNRAWAIKRQRAWNRMLGDYFKILLVGVLVLFALSTTTSSRLIQELNVIPGMSYASQFVFGHIAYLIIWPAFIMIYRFVPNTRVQWRSAVAGGVIAGTLYQFLQILSINSSILLLNRYKAIYGSFALLIVFCIWIYVSWAIVIWGAEVCAAHQHLRNLRRQRRVWRGFPYERETLALRLTALLAAPMVETAGSKPMDAGDLADALRCPPDPLNEMLELFRTGGLLIQSSDDATFLLARSPDHITILDILRLVREGRRPNHRPSAPRAIGDGQPAEQGFFGLGEAVLEPLRRKTAADLADLPLDTIHAFKL
jgi:membrane protein